VYVEICGVARVGTRTKELVKRLQVGDIAVIDHRDLDEVGADSLASARVRAVINAASSISGRYPNKGPALLLERGIPLFDNAGPSVMSVADGEPLMVKDDLVYTSSGPIARVTPLDIATVETALRRAQQNLSGTVEEFIDNTLVYAKKEKSFFVGELPLPPLHVNIRGRHALVVVRGLHYRQDLRTISSYIREMRPVLIGVDGGADALVECGHMPDMIVGDMDSVSDSTLACGAELVVQAYLDGRAPGLDRVHQLGLQAHAIPAPGTSEDLALLIAYQLGAQLIVAVGTHSSVVDFLEKGRPGMASTFLVRLKIGSVLVDAKGVSQLYTGQPGARHLLQIAVAALIPIVLVGLLSDTLRQWLRLFALGVRLALGY
jgi:uncharacterized membrane-anchored protein